MRRLENRFISKELQSKKIGRLLIFLNILTILELLYNALTGFGILVSTNMTYENVKEYGMSSYSASEKAKLLDNYNNSITLSIWILIFAVVGLLAVFLLFKFRLAIWGFIVSVITATGLILFPALILIAGESQMPPLEFMARHSHVIIIPILALLIWLFGMREYKKADNSVYVSVYK